MSPLAVAMILTGAGGLADAQDSGKPPPVPVPYMLPPPPMVVPPGTPPPPGYGPSPGRPVRVRANMNSYFSVEDYPAAALRAKAQGTTEVRVTVGPDGRVTGCVVTENSGSAVLDAATCRILRSAPATIPRATRCAIPPSNPTTCVSPGDCRRAEARRASAQPS